jgi:hypothetical protein
MSEALAREGLVHLAARSSNNTIYSPLPERCIASAGRTQKRSAEASTLSSKSPAPFRRA